MKLEPRPAVLEGIDTTACTHLHACLHMCSQDETVLCCFVSCCKPLLVNTTRAAYVSGSTDTSTIACHKCSIASYKLKLSHGR